MVDEGEAWVGFEEERAAREVVDAELGVGVLRPVLELAGLRT